MAKNKKNEADAFVNPIDPDKVAESPGLLPYAHHSGSAVIRPEDKGQIRGNAMTAMYDQTDRRWSSCAPRWKPWSTKPNPCKSAWRYPSKSIRRICPSLRLFITSITCTGALPTVKTCFLWWLLMNGAGNLRLSISPPCVCWAITPGKFCLDTYQLNLSIARFDCAPYLCVHYGKTQVLDYWLRSGRIYGGDLRRPSRSKARTLHRYATGRTIDDHHRSGELPRLSRRPYRA